MSAFKRLLQRATAPSRVVTLPISAFAETWTRRPSGPARIGLRFVSEAQIEQAQRAALDEAWRMYERPTDLADRIVARNDALFANVLAQACVDPGDVTKPYFAPAPEDLIRQALTTGGLRFLWAEYERMAIEVGPLAAEANDEELARLGAALSRFAELDAGAQVRVRRHAAVLLSELEAR